jgi:hypothetical protein
MRTLKYKIGFIFLSLCVFFSCDEDKVENNPSGETSIYSLRITNGSISGAGRFDGTVNESEKTITFTVPAESDIENVKFDGKLSLGAHIELDSYDFGSNLTQTVRVINVRNQGDYTVTLNLEEPNTEPFIDKITVLLDDGTEVTSTVDMDTKTVYLQVPDETYVTVKNVATKPVRATKTFTELNNNKLNKANPGKILLDFMGLKSEFAISFDKLSVKGADFDNGVVFDYSLNATGNDIYPDFKAENTRSADFDGKHVLIVSREGGDNPTLLTLNSVMTNNTSAAISLNKTGVAGGTYNISAGRLAQGHVYICNLTTEIGSAENNKLKIYHWATPTSVPEKIVDFDRTANGASVVSGRYGDNMSVNLDASGNGYIYLVEHVSGTQILRFTVSNFTNVSAPTRLNAPVASSYYGSYNQVDGSDNEYLLTSTRAPLMLVDKDGTELYKLNANAIPLRATDARIIYFNSARYLIFTTGCAATSDEKPTFYIYNLSSGFNTISALSEFEMGDKVPLFKFSLHESSTQANSAAYSASSGWGIVDDKLYTFGAAPRAGFSVFEFPENQPEN